MTDAPFAFVPSTAAPVEAGDALWFAFCGRRLLVTDELAIPAGPSPAALGLEPVRVQFLGRLDGRACFSAELVPEIEAPPGMRFDELRRLYGQLPEELIALAGRAIQIVDWDRTHQFCGLCAAPTSADRKQRARTCTNPACRHEFFPRLSPAIIVAVERGDEILLGRSPRFPPGIYSVLAGFVEPGESVEDAVHREVFEEAGVRIGNLRYFGSQSWPFPNSLMLGFHADYAGGELRLDPVEIEDAAFFRFDALPTTFSGRASISQWLLHDFLARHGVGRSVRTHPNGG